MLKKQITNKLFYKKYPYKISCLIKGIWLLRNLGLEGARNFCETGNIKSWLAPRDYRPEVDKDLKDFIVKFEPYFGNVKTRIEHSIFDIYVSEKSIFDKICNDLSPWIRVIWEPENQESLDFLLSNTSVKILCDEFPHKKYRYKVYIKHKINEETRRSFSKWIKNYPNKILVTGDSVKWFDNELYFTWNPCLFVEDQATLSMIGLFLGGSVQKVEEYITKVSINTTL